MKLRELHFARGDFAHQETIRAFCLRAQCGAVTNGCRLGSPPRTRPRRCLFWRLEPWHAVNAAAIEAMNEVGIDIANESPKLFDVEHVKAADAVITMGCGDACPIFPGKRYEDWALEDPAGLGVDAVRPIRDEIRHRVVELLNDLGIETK